MLIKNSTSLHFYSKFQHEAILLGLILIAVNGTMLYYEIELHSLCAAYLIIKLWKTTENKR